MLIDINNCDLNNDYFHFSNRSNVQSIMNNGLKPSVGPASQMVNDRPNVSVSMGAKGIMGIINSFIYMFSNIKVKSIPLEYENYFGETSYFCDDDLVGKDLACRAMIKKLQDEVYFKVNLDSNHLNNAEIGGLTGFDINLPIGVDSSKLELVVENEHILSAYEVAKFIYNKAKDIDIFREINGDFFYMFDNERDFCIDNDRPGMSR